MAGILDTILLQTKLFRISRHLKRIDKAFLKDSAAAYKELMLLGLYVADLSENGVPYELLADAVRTKLKPFAPRLQELVEAVVVLGHAVSCHAKLIYPVKSAGIPQPQQLAAQLDAAEKRVAELFIRATGCNPDDLHRWARELR